MGIYPRSCDGEEDNVGDLYFPGQEVPILSFTYKIRCQKKGENHGR